LCGRILAVLLTVICLAFAATVDAVVVQNALLAVEISITRVVDVISMAAVAGAGMLVGDLERLDDLDDGVVVGGCPELLVDAAVAARRRRVAELAVDVRGPRLPPEVAARRQLDGTGQGRRSIGATGAVPL